MIWEEERKRGAKIFEEGVEGRKVTKGGKVQTGRWFEG